MSTSSTGLGRLLHRAAHAPATRRRRWIIRSAAGVAVLVTAGVAAYTLPVPFLDSLIAGQVAERVSSQIACAQVTVGGDRLLAQALTGHLAEVRLTVPDATLSGVQHASFTATLHDVSQPAADRTHVGAMTAAITVGFANMPAVEGTAPPAYRRAGDGGLLVETVVPAEASGNVTAKLFLTMRIAGDSAEAVPQQLEIFGRKVAAGKAAALTGGVRKQDLPELPAGVTYRSITPRADGLHVALGGVATQALNTLPTRVGEQTVTYSAADGLLGISTAIKVEPIVDVPLTIRAAPQLDGDSLTLVPRLVHILGKDRPTDDFLSRIVLSRIDEKDLTRKLPELPPGVRYRAVTVDPAGVHVTVGGTTVQPFSVLEQPEGGPPTTFGAEGGFLTASTKGSNQDTRIQLYARPKITGNTLDIAPQQIEMFGTRFPAGRVLAQVESAPTSHALQQLPDNLTYQGVEVTPTGLLIHVEGKDVTLAKGALGGGASC
ncbi:LmeA family phospholipid-binding protein [Actinoplanes philippinensis]|uniref:LmeA family phospholipid-binding protein n=1 Tax=Actinoplanes philippinensis TaxID=35752 RepID=UPI0033E224D2